jgi:hypothetical protein
MSHIIHNEAFETCSSIRKKNRFGGYLVEIVSEKSQRLKTRQTRLRYSCALKEVTARRPSAVTAVKTSGG